MKKESLSLGFVLAMNLAWASGFGLYEMSSASHALGGTVVGEAVDASANFFNPATLSDLKNVNVSIGFVTQHPRARMGVRGEHGTAKMDPGVFVLPHIQMAMPLPAGFTFGLGGYVECGLGTEYDHRWPLANSSCDTTVESFTINPNLAYSINEKWSVAAGFRLFYFDFEQHSEPVPGHVFHRLKGDNSFRDWGWQIGTRYRLFDDFALGLVYKSMINVDVNGKSQMDGQMNRWVDAYTDIDMPESILAGFNWDVTSDWHLGGAFIWTKWSRFNELNFNLGGSITPVELYWKDTYRVALAPSWDFTDDLTWMASYAYETDCTGDQESTMLPCADRHMLATGLAWRIGGGFEIDVSYGLIIMDGGQSYAKDATGKLRQYRPHRGLSHAFGLTLTYRF